MYVCVMNKCVCDDDVLCCCVAVLPIRRSGQSKTIKVKNRAQPLVSVNSIAIACSAYVYGVWSKIIVFRSFYTTLHSVLV